MSYSAAVDQPLLRADAVLMLKGLKEPDSLRVIAGLLVDSAPAVRRNACRLMAEAEDPAGYFVKPLTGALRDTDLDVRVAAADAMGAAPVKSQAVKVLVLTLGQVVRDEPAPAPLVGAMHKALVRLTGHRPAEEATPVALAKLWSEWWHQHREALEQADQEYLDKLSGKAVPAPAQKGAAPKP